MRLAEKYKKEIQPRLKEKFGYKNDLMTPRLVKVVVNVGVGRQAKEKEYIEKVADNVARITGQKPILTKAKKSISAFKIREGMTVGVSAVLRGRRMYDFLEKLINITFPRVRDFRGLSEKNIDESGNLSVGLKEQMVFPEIAESDLDNLHGVEVSVATTAKKREEGLELFRLLGFPLRPEENVQEIKKGKRKR